MKTNTQIESSRIPSHTNAALRDESIYPLQGESAEDFLEKQNTAHQLRYVGDVDGYEGSLEKALSSRLAGLGFFVPVSDNIRYIMNDVRLARILNHKIRLCMYAFAGVDVKGFNLYPPDIPFIFEYFMTWRDYAIPEIPESNKTPDQ